MFHFETLLVAHTHNIAMSVPKIKDLLTFEGRNLKKGLKFVLGCADRREGFKRFFSLGFHRVDQARIICPQEGVCLLFNF